MPNVDRLRFIGHTKGYNTRDDQFSLEDGELLAIENCIPRGEDIIPRAGIRAVGTTIDGTDWEYPYRHVDYPHIIARKGVDLYAIRTNGSYYMIKEGAFPSTGIDVCAERIGDAVLIGCDSFTNWPGTLVTMKDGSLVANNANIFRPNVVGLGAITATSETQIDSTYTIGKMSRMFAVTFVRRTDPLGFNGTSPKTTSDFVDGASESYDEISQRYTFSGVDANFVQLRLAISLSEIPVDCTHVRVWVTQGTPWTGDERLDPDTISAGSELRYFKDVSIGDFSEVNGTQYAIINFDVTEGTLAGETHLISTLGLNELPPCKYMKYCNGRLWIGGGTYMGSPGRWYYSMPIEGDTPSRYLTMFNLSTQYVDTSIDDTERAMGIGVTKGDVIFFCEKDIWRLPNGDPDYGVTKIAEGYGTVFPNTITEYGQAVFYLSNRGPCYVSGNMVDPVNGFAAGEVWPDQYDGTPGYFHSLNRDARRAVKSFWFQDSWFIVNDDMCVAYCAPPGDPIGAWKIVPATGSGVKTGKVIVLSADRAMLLCDGKIHKFLDGKRDGYGYFYSMRVKYGPKHLDRRKRYKIAEAWDILVHARWTDNGELRTILHAEDDIRVASHLYEQRPTTEILQNSGVKNTSRRIIQQGLREGMYGTWFTVEWIKVYRDNFWCIGAEVGVIPREGSELEYMSYSDPDPYDVVVDTNLAIFDDTFQEGLDV